MGTGLRAPRCGRPRPEGNGRILLSPECPRCARAGSGVMFRSRQRRGQAISGGSNAARLPAGPRARLNPGRAMAREREVSQRFAGGGPRRPGARPRSRRGSAHVPGRWPPRPSRLPAPQGVACHAVADTAGGPSRRTAPDSWRQAATSRISSRIPRSPSPGEEHPYGPRPRGPSRGIPEFPPMMLPSRDRRVQRTLWTGSAWPASAAPIRMTCPADSLTEGFVSYLLCDPIRSRTARLAGKMAP